MLWIIVSALLLLVGLAGLYCAVRGSQEVKGGGLIACAVAFVVWLLFTGFNSFTIVDKGSVAVTSFAGKLDLDGYLGEGLNFVQPWKSTTHVEAYKRHYVDVGSAQAMETVVCGDDKQVEVDLTFGFSINPTYAARLTRHFKPEQLDQLAATAARAATRNVFIAEQAKNVYGGKTNVVDKLTVEFEARLAAQLHGLDAFAGLSDEQLKDVFSVLPVQAENILPPTRVRTAMNENQAAVIELERQKTLTDVAQQASERMQKEGAGLKNIIAELPDGTSIIDAAQLIRAVADMKRAKAVEQAVQEGKIPVIYLDGTQGTGSPTVPASPAVAAPKK